MWFRSGDKACRTIRHRHDLGTKTALTDIRTFSFPLSAADRCTALAALAEGKSLRIGGCYLSPDPDTDGWIWADDPYGCNTVASTTGPGAALEWVQEQETLPPGVHPAERLTPL